MSVRPPPSPPPGSQVNVGAYTRQVRAYEPDDPELRRKKVRRVKLDDLEQITREHYALHELMLRALPEGVFEPDFLVKIREVLHRYAGMDIDLWLHSVRPLKRTELKGLIPGTTFLAVVGLAPLTEKMLVEVDLRFVYRVVDKLLGGNGLAIDIHRPLTEIEQGVFSYVFLKVLALFQEHLVSPEQVALRMEDMRHDLKSTADVLRHEEQWIVVSYKMNFDLDVGYIRCLVPAGLAKRVVTQLPPRGSPLMERFYARLRRRMNRLAGVETEARVEAGVIELSKTDIRALDPGDIVLLEGTQLQLQDGQIHGQAVMKIGLGRHGNLHGAVYPRGDQLVFEVKQIEIVETPADHDPVVHHGEMANPEQVIAEYEDHGDQSNDGASSADDIEDEDWGLDDEDAGDDEEYAEDGYGEQGYEEGQGDQGYDGQGGYAEGGEDVPIDDNLQEAEPLLGDIPIPVVVELGRVQLSADEVIRLRPGQIIELGRAPSDPVDLVVAGKLLAKGELVEIEGALGVKLLNLVKDEG